MANTTGNVPTSSVHWFTLDETRAPKLAEGARRQANSAATSNSGASEAIGATNMATLMRRLVRVGSSPTTLAGPTRWGSSAGALARRPR